MSSQVINNAYLVSGIGEAITCDDQVFLLEGDRHHWPNNVKEEWDEQWWYKKPGQVITVKEKLVFLGKEYSAVQQAEYIFEYCMQKGWIPKIFFKTEEEAEQAKKFREYGCSIEQLKEFHAMLMHFTEKVKDHHYLEMVFGHIDEGPTNDMALVELTRKREVLEEAGHMTKAEFIGYSDPFTNRDGVTTVSALYKSHMDTKDMELVWSQVEANRRPTGYEWRCPFAWHKNIPGIDQIDARLEKAMQETCNGKWYPLQVHPRMDKKNKDTISKFIQ